MAAFIASTGTFTFVTDPVNGLTQALCLQNITVEVSNDVSEIICAGTTGNWKNTYPSARRWTASIESALDSEIGIALSTAPAIGLSGTLTLDTGGGLAYSGTAICTGADATIPSGEYATVTINFVGTGALSEA